MYRTILIGCDGSAQEADAIALAQQLRDPLHGRLILANVYTPFRGFHPPGLIAPGPTIASEYTEWVTGRAGELLDQAEVNVLSGLPCERRAVAGASVARGLNNLAEDIHADLIVLGGTHRGFAADLAGRMTVQRLLHGAPCAVAVATSGQSARFGPTPRIYVAYDGSPEAGLALEAAYRIAAATLASVMLGYVQEPVIYASGFTTGPGGSDAEARERATHAAIAELEAAAARAPHGVDVHHEVLRGSAERALTTAAADADLIVAGSRAFGALHRAVAGSTSAALLTNGTIPVLVTPRAVARPAAQMAPAVAVA